MGETTGLHLVAVVRRLDCNLGTMQQKAEGRGVTRSELQIKNSHTGGLELGGKRGQEGLSRAMV